LYFIDFPLLLLITGLLAWALPTDTMLVAASFVAAGVGCYTLWELVIRRGPIRISHIFCIANTVGYGFGALNSWFTIQRGNMDLAKFFGRDTEAVTHAIAAILISSGILYALGEIYETPVFGRDFQLALDSRVSIFIFMGTALMAVGYKLGAIGFMGASANGVHVSVLGGFLSWLFPPLLGFTAVAFLNWQGRVVKWMLGLALAAQFLMIVPTGRRNILYSMILALIALRFGAFRPKWSFVKKIIYAGLLAVLLAVSATAFYYLRYAASGAHRPLSVAERVSIAIDLYESGNTSKVNQGLQQNLKKRTFILGYLSDLLDASGRMAPALGANAFHEFQLTIPSAFWEGKGDALYQEEAIANMQFNFSYKDEANSILTAGALDFGLWGIILYPIFVWMLFRIFAEFLSVNAPPMAATFVILALLYDALITEGGLADHLLAIRSGLIFSVLLWIFSKLPKLGLHHHDSRGAAYQ
jgi:hypothetical protein